MRRLAAASAAIGFASLLLASCAGGPAASPPTSADAWLGAPVPKGLSAPPVRPTASIPPAPTPASEQGWAELKGARIKPDVVAVVGFAEAMSRESQMWGRISGFKSEADTADWVAAQFRAAGLRDVAVQTYQSSADFWWPEKWEVRALADPALGAKTSDVVLGSAVPVSRSTIAGGTLSAEVVFAGEAGSASAAGVKGKIAIQHTRPSTGAFSDRAKVRDSAKVLIGGGAVAVLNWIEQGGNMHVYDFGGCGGPCFNIGGEDGHFLKAAIDAAKAKGVSGPKLKLSLTEGMRKGLSARNVIGFIPGVSDEIVVVNAHLDSWFSGAGDNADGVAVMVALARHFAKPENKPARTLLFVGSGGHHSGGMNGPQNLVTMNGPLLKRAVLIVNLEHLAQFQIDAVPAWEPHVGEQSKGFGVSNMAPWLVNLVKDASRKYGFVINPEVNDSVPGDLGGYTPLNVARIQGIHSGPLYHTSGDIAASISEPGLEKAAHFYAYVVSEAGKAPAKSINP